MNNTHQASKAEVWVTFRHQDCRGRIRSGSRWHSAPLIAADAILRRRQDRVFSTSPQRSKAFAVRHFRRFLARLATLRSEQEYQVGMMKLSYSPTKFRLSRNSAPIFPANRN